MPHKSKYSLLTALMVFPQIIETIYSPALTKIVSGFNVPAEQAIQTLSFYFFAFALGVVFWGRMCDQIGRRLAILSGLLLYTIASFSAVFVSEFYMLLFARMLGAFGAAAGSVGAQTIMRDIYQGTELSKIFSRIGIAFAISPAIGMMTGALLTNVWGYQGVFISLAALALLLVVWSIISLPETRLAEVKTVPLVKTFAMMVRDRTIWYAAVLVAFFNVCMFSYYQLGPFQFESLGLSPKMFGYSGLLLALGVGIGSWWNKYLLERWSKPKKNLFLAALLTAGGGIMVSALTSTWLFVFPMILIMIAYGLAIPNILATALTNYTGRMGTAGALFSLLYYSMLSVGLVVAGWSQNLGYVLICCGAGALLLTIGSTKSS